MKPNRSHEQARTMWVNQARVAAMVGDKEILREAAEHLARLTPPDAPARREAAIIRAKES